MIDRRALLGGFGAAMAGATTGALAAAPAASASDQFSSSGEWIDLWPGSPPGLPPRPPKELIKERLSPSAPPILEIDGVVRPRLMVLRPARPNGMAALVVPGGGYTRLVVARQGPEIARWLVERGWTVFTLLYRLPGEGWERRADVPLQDGQRAMRLIRSRASAFGIHPQRITVLGSSAGGHLCADLATRFDAMSYPAIDSADRLSARPDLAVPVYAVQTMTAPDGHKGSRDKLLGPDPSPSLVRLHSPENNVPANAPPFVLIHAEDDPTVSVENSLRMRLALKAAKIRVETHLFPDGGHGFGIARVATTTTRAWPELVLNAARFHLAT